MSDRFRPHKFPDRAPAEVVAWECAACGEWVREVSNDTDCAVDWRRGER